MNFEQDAKIYEEIITKVNDPMRRITVYNSPSFLQECAKEFTSAYIQATKNLPKCLDGDTSEAIRIAKRSVILAQMLVQELKETMYD